MQEWSSHEWYLLRDQSNANRVQCEPNPDVGTERKEKEILVAVPNSSTSNKEQKQQQY
jgi:hypothetical protein